MEKRFGTLLKILGESGLVSTVTAEKARKEYKILLHNKDFLEKAKEFDVKSQRVDDFHATIFSKGKDYQDLLFITKKVLILSHGNGRVESGFSINEDLLNENMKQELIVAQRVVYGGVMQEGGILKVNVSKEMMAEVRKSRSRYQLALEEKKKNQTEKEKQSLEKRRLTTELKQVQT